MDRAINETGNRYGRLVVLEYAGKRNRSATWLCRCDCGTEKVVLGDYLRRGNTKSCGCLRKETAPRPPLPEGMAAFNQLYGIYKTGAARRGYCWELTKEEFRAMTEASCYYCGTKPSQVNRPLRCNGGYTYNGVDRVDNSQGYTKDNTVACCGRCNLAKGQMSVDEFRAWLDRAYHYMFHP